MILTFCIYCWYETSRDVLPGDEQYFMLMLSYLLCYLKQIMEYSYPFSHKLTSKLINYKTTFDSHLICVKMQQTSALNIFPQPELYPCSSQSRCSIAILCLCSYTKSKGDHTSYLNGLPEQNCSNIQHTSIYRV